MTTSNGIRVYISTEEQEKTFDRMKAIAINASSGASLMVAKNILSTELVKFLIPITRETNFSPNLIADKILTDYPLDKFVTAEDIGMVYSIIYNEIYKIALESTSITGKDHAAHINNNIDIIKSTCNIVVKILSNEPKRI